MVLLHEGPQFRGVRSCRRPTPAGRELARALRHGLRNEVHPGSTSRLVWLSGSRHRPSPERVPSSRASFKGSRQGERVVVNYVILAIEIAVIFCIVVAVMRR